jgi:hypothetical protein
VNYVFQKEEIKDDEESDRNKMVAESFTELVQDMNP